MSKLSEARRQVVGLGMTEAQEELKKLRRRLFELRLQLARGEVKNNRQFQQTKKDIARLMFHLGELNRGVEPEPEAEETAAESSSSKAPAKDEATSTTAPE